MRNRIVLLGVVVGLLVGAAGVALLVVTDDNGSTSVSANLPKLPAGAYGERTAAAADMMPVRPVEWRVKGELPSLPDRATAYRSSANVTADAVTELARALGVGGTPQFQGGTWTVGAAERRLQVTAFGWNLGSGSDCMPPVDVPPDMAVSCAASSGVAVAPCPPGGLCPYQPPPTTPPDLPSKDEARRIALRVLDNAGIDTSGNVEVSGPGDAWEVSAEPRIDGRRLIGGASNLSIGPKGAIIRGGGMLPPSEALGDYPLVSTAKGVERLKSQSFPVPMRGGPEPAIAVDGGAPVQDTSPVVRTITGATLGLQSVPGPQGAFAVPVFLFAVDDGSVVPVPAVVDALLEQPGGGPEPAPVPKPGGPPQEVPPSPGTGGGNSGGSNSQACAGTSSAASANGSGNDNQPLTLEVCASPSHPKVGETVTFSLKASDPDAAMDADGCQQPTAGFGDEADQSVRCMSICSRESFPPQATAVGRTFTHAYAKPGTYTATFTADSCAPKASHGEATLEIVVTA
ncbi:MAG: hypothetical protein QOE35_714 [Actinomycetota bacterium]|jgi:hypothetical protein